MKSSPLDILMSRTTNLLFRIDHCLAFNEMCELIRRTLYQKIKKVCRQNNPQSLKSTITSRFKCGLKGKDGFQSLAFEITKYLHRCLE